MELVSLVYTFVAVLVIISIYKLSCNWRLSSITNIFLYSKQSIPSLEIISSNTVTDHGLCMMENSPQRYCSAMAEGLDCVYNNYQSIYYKASRARLSWHKPYLKFTESFPCMFIITAPLLVACSSPSRKLIIIKVWVEFPLCIQRTLQWTQKYMTLINSMPPNFNDWC